MDDNQWFAPWGVVTPAFWSTHPPTQLPRKPAAPPQPASPGPSEGPANADTPPEPPEEYRERITAVAAAFDSQDPDRLAAAITDAEILDKEITARYGDTHPYTVNIRELRGWLAHLTGDHTTAARWYLHTTALQAATHGPRHRLTRSSARRAVATWRSITDPHQARTIGADILAMLAEVAGENSQPHREVRARLAGLRPSGSGP